MKKFKNTVEESFNQWCIEAKAGGVISYFEYEPETIQLIPKATTVRHKQLKTKIKTVDKFLLNPLSYTADFYIRSINNLEHLGLTYTHISNGEYFYAIDTKGGFQQHNDAKYFSAIRKVVYSFNGVFVNKVVCEKWFLKTFCPLPTRDKEDLVWTDKFPRRKRSTFKNCKTYEQLQK